MATRGAADAAERVFDVIFECDAVNTGRMRTDMRARMVQPEQCTFDLATDEGAMHGGDNSAPTPLMLFAGGLAACLMTQLRAFAKRLRVPVGEIRLSTRLHWVGRQRGREPYVSEPVRFSIDIEMASEAPLDDQKRLIEAAKKGCFVEQTLMRPNAVAHRLKADGGWIEV